MFYIYKFHSVDILSIVNIQVDAQWCCEYQLKKLYKEFCLDNQYGTKMEKQSNNKKVYQTL